MRPIKFAGLLIISVFLAELSCKMHEKKKDKIVNPVKNNNILGNRLKRIFTTNCTLKINLFSKNSSLKFLDKVYPLPRKSGIMFSYDDNVLLKDTILRIESKNLQKTAEQYDSILKQMKIDAYQNIDFGSFQYKNDIINEGEELNKIITGRNLSLPSKFKRLDKYLFYFFLDLSGKDEINTCFYNKITREVIYGKIETSELYKPIFYFKDIIGDSDPEIFVISTDFDSGISKAAHLDIYKIQ